MKQLIVESDSLVKMNALEERDLLLRYALLLDGIKDGLRDLQVTNNWDMNSCKDWMVTTSKKEDLGLHLTAVAWDILFFWTESRNGLRDCQVTNNWETWAHAKIEWWRPAKVKTWDFIWWMWLQRSSSFCWLTGTWQVLGMENQQAHGHNDIWAKIWKWPTYEKIKYFLWKAAWERLQINIMLANKNTIQHCTCQLGYNSLDSSIHILQDCRDAKEVWKKLVNPSTYNIFFSLPVQDWII